MLNFSLIFKTLKKILYMSLFLEQIFTFFQLIIKSTFVFNMI